MKVNSNDLHIASCAVHQNSATISIRLEDRQIPCGSCHTHVVYSVSASYSAACLRCVSSYIHSCMPGKDADMLYSRLDLLLPYVCDRHSILAAQT